MNQKTWIHYFAICLTTAALLHPAALWAQTKKTDPNDAKKFEALEKKIEDLEKRLDQKPADDSKSFLSGLNPVMEGLHFGAYGENKLRFQETPTGDKFGFDATRIVLLGHYRVTDKIIFNTELEWEHGGVASGGGKAFESGEIEVEQLYIDFLINEHFNWRSPGVSLVPVGYINLHHEPTQFYSTERPELYRELIPSTWFEGSTSIFGKIVDGLDYQFQVGMGLEDNRATAGSGALTGAIDGRSGIRPSRSTTGSFNQNNSDLSYALRLAYNPTFIPGLAGSSSVYFARTTPRLLPGTFVPGNSEVGLINTELRYRLPATGVELRGEYVHVYLGHNKNLLANNDGNPTNNTGNQMHGYSLEGAYHIDLAKFTSLSWDLVPFYRYTEIDLQTGGYQGADANAPTGQGDRTTHTFGASLFVNPKVVLKADYAIPLDETASGPNSKRFQLGVGWFF